MNPWTVACQTPLSMGFPGQEYRNRQPSSSPGCLPDPGTEPGSPHWQADSFTSEPPGKPKFKAHLTVLKQLPWMSIPSVSR